MSETPCNSKQILYLECGNLECGINPAYTPVESRIPNNKGIYSALNGDWPWYSFLTRESQYACDATLIAEGWLLTSSACFTNHPFPSSKVEATLGSVRILTKSPLSTQERDISALVHSPANYNSRLTLVRLETAVNVSDYTRPICIHQENGLNESLKNANCVALAWDTKEDRLKYMKAKVVHSDECLSSSSSSIYDETTQDLNLCVKLIYSEDANCLGCGVAGRPLYCHVESKWQLVAIERIHDGESGHEFLSTKQPRWFSKISANSHWAIQIIQSFSKQSM